MSRVSIFGRSIAPTIVAFFLVLIASVIPSFASAQTASVQTQQLLPPGQNMCQTITATSIDPHVYGGVLESFDVTVSDTSGGYVGILASVGNSAIPLNYITRWAGSPTGLRIHVDTPDITVGNMTTIELTLLSSLPNQPTCITSIAFDVSGSGTIGAATSPTASTGNAQNAYGGIPTAQNSSQPTQSTSATNMPNTVSGATQSTRPMTSASSSTATQSSSSSVSLGAGVAAASNAKMLSSICSGSNAYRLWFILLAIYVVIVALVVFAEPWFLEDSVLGSTASILVPLILLLAFWYFSAPCRAAAWIPVAACVIAIVGLFLAFREYETTPLLPASTNS